MAFAWKHYITNKRRGKKFKMASKWLPCMNIKMGSCHANLILLQGELGSYVLIWRRKFANRHNIPVDKNKHNTAIAKTAIMPGRVYKC